MFVGWMKNGQKMQRRNNNNKKTHKNTNLPSLTLWGLHIHCAEIVELRLKLKVYKMFVVFTFLIPCRGFLCFLCFSWFPVITLRAYTYNTKIMYQFISWIFDINLLSIRMQSRYYHKFAYWLRIASSKYCSQSTPTTKKTGKILLQIPLGDAGVIILPFTSIYSHTTYPL